MGPNATPEREALLSEKEEGRGALAEETLISQM